MSYGKKCDKLSVPWKIMKSKKKKKRLINYIIDIITQKNHEKKVNSPVECPYCHSNNSIKNGKNNNKQRYFCKSCNKSYMGVTNSVIYHTRKNISVWKKYVYCLINQYSLRTCAALLKIDLKTSFFWRHKILDALEEQLEVGELGGEIQMNAIYIRRNFKGNHKKSSFEIRRKSYKRGPMSVEDVICRDHVCVMGAMNHMSEVIMKPICISNPKVEDMVNAFHGVIKSGSVLVTDTHYNYREFAKRCNVKHIAVKRYSFCDNSYNVSKITSFLRSYEYFIKPYRGIATKYLSGYISLYKYISKKLYIKREYIGNAQGKAGIINTYKIEPLFKCSNHAYFNKNLKERPMIFQSNVELDPIVLW